MRRMLSIVGMVLVTVCAAGPAAALVVPREETRFDRVIRYDPSSRLGTLAERPEALPGFDAERAGWEAFQDEMGGAWQVYVDRRSGAPLLAQGSGVRWVPADRMGSITPSEMERLARDFVAGHETLFKVRGEELVLDREATGPMNPNHWIVAFRRVVNGASVEGHRFVLYVSYGNLVAFGATRWSATPAPAPPVYGPETAREVLRVYMGLTPSDQVLELESGTRVWLPVPPTEEAAGRYRGPVGEGIALRPAYRFALRVAGERGTWVGKVDAVTGEVLALFDDDRYAGVQGGVYPISNDGQDPGGTELPNLPMPWADVSLDGSPFTANDMGMFTCSPTGGTATTTLNGPYVRISDNCGAVSESVTCDNDLDLGSGFGDNCAVPPGASPGDTHSARTCFYHLNRIKEKGRYWLPSNTWLTGKLTANVNINSTCNAYWNGTVNFYKSGGGCRNTGEIAAVLNHEYGHGLDQNDGGGYDNPSEAYADVVAIVEHRDSCVGRGFFMSGTCSGYGDTCLVCTGIREMDWDKRASHTPATPANFTGTNCGGGSGPCGKEVHCESYPPSETFFDLAYRDLPASGMDPDTSWQLAEKLFYVSRQGSGGDAFNCSLPASDGCGAGTWFTQARVADDDDGNLDNGTPHAAAIFAAFNRHALACGNASDPSNQDSSSCPALASPALTVAAGSNSASLSWTPVADATNYLILRNEISCGFSQNVVATVAAPTTSYTDTDLPNGLTLYYRVQAQGSNTACDGPVSACMDVTPQPFAGSIKLDKAVYSCGSTIQISVLDANIGSSTTTATIFSNTETQPETVILTETPPGSAKYIGTIQATSGTPQNGDGMLSVVNDDLITARYIDADDGEGGTNLTRETTATTDCIFPVISNVQTNDVTDVSANVTWTTDEASSSVVRWGDLKPPTNVTETPGLTTAHGVDLTGLQQCTVYYYQAESQDPPGNLAVDDRNGQYYRFETLGDFGDGLQPCHAGRVSLQQPIVGCSDVLSIKVVDIDLNLSSTDPDTVDVTVTSTTETDPEVVTLTETGPNTSQFTGTIATAPDPAVPGDGVLQASDGDYLTATYHDADDGSGSPAVSFATADADCAGSGFDAVQVVQITDADAKVRVNTAEGTTVRLDWGSTPALGNVVTDDVLRTTRDLLLEPLDECGRLYFRVTATDAYGNVSVFDADGAPMEFNAYEIPGAIFKDGFETSTGWSLEGEWEIGLPQGLGSPDPDPSQAFAGTEVLGDDLSGQGAHPGDYEVGVVERAASPAMDASGLTKVEVKFRRWLHVGVGGVAYVEVNAGSGWQQVWDSGSLGLSDSSWSLQTIDISNLVAGNSSFQVGFKQRGGFQEGNLASGWNVDRFLVRDGTFPPFDACGSCGGTPGFAGISSATDVDGCADSGVQLQWTEASAWGTGHAGSYAVYRDTTPGFDPAPVNLIGSGVTGTSYLDDTAPNDVTLYYIVRAENDETCGGGPNNGGTMDGNRVTVSARDETTQPAPGDVGPSLHVDPVNDAHARLSWAATPGAAVYHVYRASSAQGPFARIAETTNTYYEDRDQLDPAISNWYYRVVAADSCGNEGP